MVAFIQNRVKNINVVTSFSKRLVSKWLAGSVCIMLLTLAATVNGYDSYSDRYYDPRIPGKSFGAGALAGAQEDVNAIFGNPAFLSSLKGMEVTLATGMLPGNHISTALAFAQPIPLIGKIGLGLTSIHLNDPQEDDPFQAEEQALLIGYSVDLLPWLSVGARFREIRLETSSLTASGEGLDLGFKLQYDYYWFGVTGINLLHPVIDSKIEDIGYPYRLIADLGASWPGILRTMVEFSQTFGDDPVNRIAWGIESDFSKVITIRAGVDTNAVYVGLGTGLDRWKLDYASRVDLNEQNLTHWVGISGHFGTYEVVLSPSSKFLTKGGRNNSVLLRINHHRDKIFKEWVFKVIDEQGRLVYRQEGKNGLPPELRWEGRDARRNMVKDGNYWLSLEGRDAEGNSLQSNQVKIKVVTRRTMKFIQTK